MECGDRVAGIVCPDRIGWTSTDIIATVVDSPAFSVQNRHVILAACLEHSLIVDIRHAFGSSVTPMYSRCLGYTFHKCWSCLARGHRRNTNESIKRSRSTDQYPKNNTSSGTPGQN